MMPGSHVVASTKWQNIRQCDRLVGKATITNGLHFGRSEVLRSLKHFLWVQSPGCHHNDCLEERGMASERAQQSSLKVWEKAILNQSNWKCFKGNIEKLLRRGKTYLGFLCKQIPFWSEVSWKTRNTHWVKGCPYRSQIMQKTMW